MRTLAQFALTLCVAAAVLAACGGSQPPIGAPGAMPQASTLVARTGTASYKVVYSFGALPDGSSPQASLIDVGGTLYGTTSGGGSYSCVGQSYNGCGTVFSITPSGEEKVVYSFGAAGDGRTPFAGLVDMGGTLYGTTSVGGSHKCNGESQYYYGCGTVFSITPAGAEKVLYSFGNEPDGSSPLASLIGVKGTLFGTTAYGAAPCNHYETTCGTVFSVTTGGTEKIVYRFGGGSDGANPYAGLIDVGGKLYGTTHSGTRHYGGTVFRITTSGVEKTLHGFGKAGDGSESYASLIDVNGTLYGTTARGGAYLEGTVFSIAPHGREKVLHSFGHGTDGARPEAALIEEKGTLYGTTSLGGTYPEYGTVFSITTSGAESVLHSFKGGSDGAVPADALLNVNGTLYGTTTYGGENNHGTVFSLKP